MLFTHLVILPIKESIKVIWISSHHKKFWEIGRSFLGYTLSSSNIALNPKEGHLISRPYFIWKLTSSAKIWYPVVFPWTFEFRNSTIKSSYKSQVFLKICDIWYVLKIFEVTWHSNQKDTLVIILSTNVQWRQSTFVWHSQ